LNVPSFQLLDSQKNTCLQKAHEVKKIHVTKELITRVEFSSRNTAAISWLSIANARRPVDHKIIQLINTVTSDLLKTRLLPHP